MVPDLQKTQTVYNNKKKLEKKLGNYCVNLISLQMYICILYARDLSLRKQLIKHILPANQGSGFFTQANKHKQQKCTSLFFLHVF